MAKVRLPLYRPESKWAIAALIAGLLMAVALWAVWSWNDSRYFVSRNLLHQSRAAHLPLSTMLENAEARLAAVADKPRHIRDGGSNTPEVLQSAEHALYGIARPI